MKLSNKIEVPTSCEPYFYTTEDDLSGVEIGDVIAVTFKDKGKVKSKYRGKTVKFLVNNFIQYKWRRTARRLALIPLTSIDLEKESFNEEKVIILDDSDRFEALMIDLYEVNKIPFRGWRKKTVTFVKDENKLELTKD